MKYEINSLENIELLLSIFTLSKLSNYVARFRSNFMPWQNLNPIPLKFVSIDIYLYILNVL